MKTIEKKFAFPFPIIRYEVDIQYTEVERASGISYILMQLINQGIDSDEPLSVTLKSFDIAPDLHDIFAQELCEMARDKGILEMVNGTWDVEEILEYPAGNFAFTEDGLTMFQKGMISTGELRNKRVVIYFDPIDNRFETATTISKKFPSAALKELVEPLWKEHYSEYGKDQLLTWTKEHQQTLNIPAGSSIVSIDVQSSQVSIRKISEPILVTYCDQEARAFFEVEADQKAFESLYDQSTASQILRAYNPPFRTGANGIFYPDQVDVTTLDERVTGFYLPAEINDLLLRPNCLVAFNKRYLLDEIRDKSILSCDAHVSETILDEINVRSELMLLNQLGGRIFTPATLVGDHIPEVDVLIEQTLSKCEFEEILDICFRIYSQLPLSKEAVKVMKYLDGADRNQRGYITAYAERICQQLMTKKECIDALLEMNESFEGPGWETYFQETVMNMFRASLASDVLEDIHYLDTVYAKAISLLKVEKYDYFSMYIDAFRGKNSDISIVEALGGIGCAPENILSKVNVIPTYMTLLLENKSIYGKSGLAQSFEDCRRAFGGLNHLLGIDTYNDDFEGKITNPDAFFTLYNRFDRTFQEILRYEHLAKEEFGRLKEFSRSYEYYREDAVLRKQAEEKPELLRYEEVKGLQKQGEDRKVISILYYRLQSVLSRYSSEGKLYHLIEAAWEQGYITSDEQRILHEYRKCRNGLEHPNAPKYTYRASDIEEWIEVIFGLERK